MLAVVTTALLCVVSRQASSPVIVADGEDADIPTKRAKMENGEGNVSVRDWRLSWSALPIFRSCVEIGTAYHVQTDTSMSSSLLLCTLFNTHRLR